MQPSSTFSKGDIFRTSRKKSTFLIQRNSRYFTTFDVLQKVIVFKVFSAIINVIVYRGHDYIDHFPHLRTVLIKKVACSLVESYHILNCITRVYFDSLTQAFSSCLTIQKIFFLLFVVLPCRATFLVTSDIPHVTCFQYCFKKYCFISQQKYFYYSTITILFYAGVQI